MIKERVSVKKNSNGLFKPYKEQHDYSYAFGAYATIELIRARSEIVRSVYIHSKCKNKATIENLCQRGRIPVTYDDRLFSKTSPKENHYVLGVFEKYVDNLEAEKPHIVLVSPRDCGNLGTIIRLAAGFCICNLGIIQPAADVFNPKTVRASMGSLFRINFQQFESFEEYQGTYGQHMVFAFSPDAEATISLENCPKVDLFALVFGNEAAGLDKERYAKVGTYMRIPQSGLVDSLNISVAAGIGTFVFANRNGLI